MKRLRHAPKGHHSRMKMVWQRSLFSEHPDRARTPTCPMEPSMLSSARPQREPTAGLNESFSFHSKEKEEHRNCSLHRGRDRTAQGRWLFPGHKGDHCSTTSESVSSHTNKVRLRGQYGMHD